MPKKKNSKVPVDESQCSGTQDEETIDVPPAVSEWFEAGRIFILNSIEERSSNNLKDRKKAEEAKSRLKDLSTGSDVVGVSFAGDPLQHLYYSTKFERRGILLYAILSRLLGAVDPASSLRTELVECRRLVYPLLTQACGRSSLQVVSVGGGPVRRYPNSRLSCHPISDMISSPLVYYPDLALYKFILINPSRYAMRAHSGNPTQFTLTIILKHAVKAIDNCC